MLSINKEVEVLSLSNEISTLERAQEVESTMRPTICVITCRTGSEHETIGLDNIVYQKVNGSLISMRSLAMIYSTYGSSCVDRRPTRKLHSTVCDYPCTSKVLWMWNGFSSNVINWLEGGISWL